MYIYTVREQRIGKGSSDYYGPRAPARPPSSDSSRLIWGGQKPRSKGPKRQEYRWGVTERPKAGTQKRGQNGESLGLRW